MFVPRVTSGFRSPGAACILPPQMRVPLAVWFAVSVLSASAAGSGPHVPERSERARTLTLADRVRYQRAVEDVYWRHRIWPKERERPKPPLGEVMSPAQIEQKVQSYLRNSEVLRHTPHRITAEKLQAEIERMARHTKNAEMLHELFIALGNDPFVVAECLARPALSERLVAELQMDLEGTTATSQVGQAQLQSADQLRANDTITDAPIFTRYSLPVFANASNTATDNTWSPLIDLPARRANHSAVWTGSEMIVFGGRNYDVPVGTGDRYNPATDTWSRASLTNAPVARSHHTAIWTGTEMIVWGGFGEGDVILNSGGKYDPANDSWMPTSISNAPTHRAYQTAVWTGAAMIIWGGADASGFPSTGGSYDPKTDAWKTINTTNAPEGRFQHSVVWTGSEMVVWGGRIGVEGYLNSGAKYKPASDTWTSSTAINAPAARFGHSAVWTGSEMIIWGGWNGYPLRDGASYNPASNTWAALGATNPPQARYSHSGVWTGSEMIVWGGNAYPDGQANSGGRYNPATNKWTPMRIMNAPSPRDTHTAVWTGSEMIVFGGGYGETYNTGGRYDPTADRWTSVRTTNTPEGRYRHTAIWTGSEMIVWGGSNNFTSGTNTGGRYDPALDSWTPTSTVNAPEGREAHTVVWTGTEMIVWGGWYSNGFEPLSLNTGGRYDPATDSWRPTSLTNAPAQRRWHSAVWTGTEMIVWGGEVYNVGNVGGRYNPETDSWLPTSATNAPRARQDHSAVWTGDEMIVWGGSYGAGNTGGRYNPRTDIWTAMNTIGTESRTGHSAIWTGTEMIVWGGYNGSVHVNTGARYNPRTDSWSATTLSNAPDGRIGHAVAWSGQEMIVWGGYNEQQDQVLNTGGRYNPATNTWTATSTVGAPIASEFPTAVWTGSTMILWGGLNVYYDPFGERHLFVVSTGGTYSVAPPAPAVRPINISTRVNVLTGDKVAIAGFIVRGTGTKNVLIRGMGPSLTSFGVSSVLADPVLALHTQNRQGADVTIATNDDWKINAQNGESQEAAVTATGIPPGNDAEAAILANLNPGSYTAILSGKSNGTGNSLVEVYDLNDGSSRLTNISTRGFVGRQDRVMIGGFILGPAAGGYATVVVRAIGPTLGGFGISNFLADPTLELRDADGALLAANDNWQSDPEANQIPSGLKLADGKESALRRTLNSGNYTAVVRGKNNTTGVALVEVYYLR